MDIVVRSRNRKAWVIAAFAGSLILAGAFIAALAVRDDGSTRTQDSLSNPQASVPAAQKSGGQGGGGEPSAALLAVHDSIPQPAGITVDQAPVSTGDGLLAVYWVSDVPGKVTEFYRRELPLKGWAEQNQLANGTAGQKDDGSTLASSTLEFTRPGFKVTFSVGPSSKDTSKGATHLAITIERQ